MLRTPLFGGLEHLDGVLHARPVGKGDALSALVKEHGEVRHVARVALEDVRQQHVGQGLGADLGLVFPAAAPLRPSVRQLGFQLGREAIYRFVVRMVGGVGHAATCSGWNFLNGRLWRCAPKKEPSDSAPMKSAYTCGSTFG